VTCVRRRLSVEPLSLAESDIFQHLVQFGIDVFPPINLPDERTRLSVFFDEASHRWGSLFQRQVISNTEFRVSAEFRASGQPSGPATRLDTFILSERGPIVAFPIRLPGPIGDTGLEGSYLDTFRHIRELFFHSVPAEHRIMRLGLVRNLVFGTGDRRCTDMLAAPGGFSGAELVDGNRLLVYRDDLCNVRIQLQPIEVRRSIKGPLGTAATERLQFGMNVLFDVNNHDMRQLEPADIEQVIERAVGLWPDALLQFLNGGTGQ
jgi:hypothetical protein